MTAALARSRRLRRRRSYASNVKEAYWSQKNPMIDNTPAMSR
jgi:hypothetical protein